jgi:predicted DNA-binding protein
MAKAKKTVGLRLSEDTIKELESLAKREGVSQADVVTILVHAYYVGGDEMDIEKLEEWFRIVKMT